MKLFLLTFILLFPFQPLMMAEIKLDIISQIESSNNPKAYNKRSEARGLFQITPIVLLHYNRLHRSSFSSKDLFSPEINKKIAEWYLGWLKKICKNDREVLISYNYGLKHRKDKVLPKETENYLGRYEALLRKSKSRDV